jgi:hypothetical protein
VPVLIKCPHCISAGTPPCANAILLA